MVIVLFVSSRHMTHMTSRDRAVQGRLPLGMEFWLRRPGAAMLHLATFMLCNRLQRRPETCVPCYCMAAPG